MPDESERPRVTGSWDELDDVAAPLLTAIGKVVFAVASLEKALQVEASRLLVARHASDPAIGGRPLDEQLSTLDHLTGGRLLKRLRELGIPDELDRRIGAVIDRRNRLVHHMMEDADFVRAFGGGPALETSVRHLERLAIDAAELVVEFHLFAIPKLNAMLGLSPSQMVDLVTRVDPTTLPDGADRRQLEALQAFAEVADLNAALDEMFEDPTSD